MPDQAIGDVVIPASDISTAIAIADLGKIDNRHPASVTLQLCRYRRNKTGLAASGWRDYMGVAATKQCFQKLSISVAPNVTRTHRVQWDPDTKELAGYVQFLIFAIALPVSHGYNTT